MLIFGHILKIGHFYNYSGKYHLKFGHFVIFFIHNFLAKMSCSTKLTAQLLYDYDIHVGRLENMRNSFKFPILITGLQALKTDLFDFSSHPVHTGTGDRQNFISLDQETGRNVLESYLQNDYY